MGELTLQTASLTFLVSAVVIVIAGTKLAKFGDVLADLTGLGRVWIGALLLAGATSLPEALTCISAVAWLDAPDLALGDLFGASMLNMFTLALVDLLNREAKVWHSVSYSQILIAGLAIVLAALVALFIIADLDTALFGRLGWDTMLIASIYVFGLRFILQYETGNQNNSGGEASAAEQTMSLKRASLLFAAAAVTIVIFAPLLAKSAKSIADITGIGTTFIGASLVALATSLPEMVTSLAAVRLGAYDLAVGNLFGSNAFNMMLVLPTDLAYSEGSLLASVGSTQTVAGLLAIVLMSIGIMGVMFRKEKRWYLLEPDSIILAIVYFVGLFLLFRLGVTF